MERRRTSKNRAVGAKDIKVEASSQREATSDVQSYVMEQLLPTLWFNATNTALLSNEFVRETG